MPMLAKAQRCLRTFSRRLGFGDDSACFGESFLTPAVTVEIVGMIMIMIASMIPYWRVDPKGTTPLESKWSVSSFKSRNYGILQVSGTFSQAWNTLTSQICSMRDLAGTAAIATVGFNTLTGHAENCEGSESCSTGFFSHLHVRCEEYEKLTFYSFTMVAIMFLIVMMCISASLIAALSKTEKYGGIFVGLYTCAGFLGVVSNLLWMSVSDSSFKKLAKTAWYPYPPPGISFYLHLTGSFIVLGTGMFLAVMVCPRVCLYDGAETKLEKAEKKMERRQRARQQIVNLEKMKQATVGGSGNFPQPPGFNGAQQGYEGFGGQPQQIGYGEVAYSSYPGVAPPPCVQTDQGQQYVEPYPPPVCVSSQQYVQGNFDGMQQHQQCMQQLPGGAADLGLGAASPPCGQTDPGQQYGAPLPAGAPQQYAPSPSGIHTFNMQGDSDDMQPHRQSMQKLPSAAAHFGQGAACCISRAQDFGMPREGGGADFEMGAVGGYSSCGGYNMPQGGSCGGNFALSSPGSSFSMPQSSCGGDFGLGAPGCGYVACGSPLGVPSFAGNGPPQYVVHPNGLALPQYSNNPLRHATAHPKHHMKKSVHPRGKAKAKARVPH